MAFSFHPVFLYARGCLKFRFLFIGLLLDGSERVRMGTTLTVQEMKLPVTWQDSGFDREVCVFLM